jgi:hypothetical protein
MVGAPRPRREEGAYCKIGTFVLSTQPTNASHKSNPPPWVTWEVVTGVEDYPVEGCHCTHWITGLWSTQAYVEGIVPKVAWHWGSDSSVINDPHGEPGRAPLYVGLLSTWGSVDCDLMFFPNSEEGSFFGDCSRH